MICDLIAQGYNDSMIHVVLYGSIEVTRNVPADTLDASTHHFECEKKGVVANALKLNHPGKNCLHFAEVWARGSPVGRLRSHVEPLSWSAK